MTSPNKNFLKEKSHETEAYDSSSYPEEIGERYVYLPDKATFVRVAE